MPKSLKEVLNGMQTVKQDIPDNLSETEIKGISFLSDKVKSGEIFVAIKGLKHDGHNYIDEAFKNGASLAVISNEKYLKNNPGVLVSDTREALAILARNFYSNPSSSLNIIGITGTNGKTTTNWITYHLLSSLGSPTLRLGTLGKEAMLKDGKVVLVDPDTLTTSDSLYLQNSLEEANKLQIANCVMEVSSHALAQKRVHGIDFNVAVFTNLTQDHLDYHQSFDEYYSAKRKLFELLSCSSKSRRVAVININDKYGLKLYNEVKSLGLEIMTFGDLGEANIQIQDISQSFRETLFHFKIFNDDVSISTNFIGHHNAENFAASIGVALALGHPLEKIKEALKTVPQVPGRLEACGNEEVGVYVDYAHTPDALRNVIQAVRPIVKNKLWVIFGCGGDRDRTKRPLMAEIAVNLADKAVLTSDNPRTEDPEFILQDVMSKGHKPAIVEVDRRLAIKRSLESMEKGDILLITGKGHENYQIIGTKRYPFSDLEEVKKHFS